MQRVNPRGPPIVVLQSAWRAVVASPIQPLVEQIVNDLPVLRHAVPFYRE